MFHLRQLRVQRHHHALRRIVARLQAVTCIPPQAASEQTRQVKLQAVLCTLRKDLGNCGAIALCPPSSPTTLCPSNG